MQIRPASARKSEADALGWVQRAVGLHGARGGYTGKGVRVALLDTGIDPGNETLRQRLAGPGRVRAFVPGEDTADGWGHGTHTAGLLLGWRAMSGEWSRGLAPDADLRVAKVVGHSGRGRGTQILDGLEWAASTGVRIVCIAAAEPWEERSPMAEAYEEAAARLLTGRPGVLVIAAAGNDSHRPFFTRPLGLPAACPSVLAVAAVDREDRVAYFSGRDSSGCAALVAAPGVGVRSAWLGGGCRARSGTSVAAAVATSLAALTLEADPSLTAVELGQRLRQTARPLGDRRDCGHGLVQAPRRPVR